MSAAHAMFPRARSTRYLFAAVAAVMVVSTLYYLQIPEYAHLTEHLPAWSPPPNPSNPWQHPATPLSPLWDARADKVRKAYQHAYQGYLKYANGFDELRPLSNTGTNNFNGWNVTMYDSLDTMLLMGLHEEFAAALPIIEKGSFNQVVNSKYPHNADQYAPFFETVIRYLGGLLSAYALSGEKILLDKADELGTLLEPAFGTAKGFPVFGVNTANAKTTNSISGILAEIASCQVEWTYLAHATGSKKHFDVGNRVLEGLEDAMRHLKGGMFPTHWNLGTGRPGSDSRSVGAAADSAHEYLLKQHLLTGKRDIANLQNYLLMTNEVITRLMYMTPNRQLLYATDVSGTTAWPSHNYEHLSCFFPGLLALGAHTLPLNLSIIDPATLNPEARRSYRLMEQYDLRSLHMAAAEGLATTCWLLYKEMPSGLGAEATAMDPKSTLWIDALEKWRQDGMQGPLPALNEKKVTPYTRNEYDRTPTTPWDYAVRRTDYFLRPETIESIYLMWKTTGNPVWRERGWDIFEALEKEAKTPSGYASLRSNLQSPAPKADEQPSFFLAETLKYLYLLFSNADPVPLDKWVFNTEAHPLPVFAWSDWEKHKFDIRAPR
ncbi:seven-hairpin glycosidase [Earliella scabrosa]|nr:seven-hairpin glycosidase [Earliella scabrosa]